MRKNNQLTLKMTLVAFLTALACVLHYFESFFTIAGFRVGLANGVGMFALIYLGPWYYVSVTLLRILITALFTGFGTSFFLSLGGGVLAMAASLLVYFLTKASVYGISSVGAFFHVTGQIGVYILIVQTPYMLLYFPVLALFSIITGILMALLISLVVKSLPSADKLTKGAYTSRSDQSK